MTLLCELQPAIAKAMDSLGGKKPTKSVTDGFYFYAAKHINIAVDTFILLRREHRLDGARLIVRPALETMLRLRAVRAKPHLFYRVAYSQTLESDRWLGGVARRRAIPYTPVYGSPQWQAFKTRCASEFGAHNVVDARLDSYAAAKVIGAEAYYETHYRAYCQSVHGTLEAVSGNLDELIDPQDTRVMLSSAMSALEALVDIRADCPGMKSFHERFLKVMKQNPDKLRRHKPI